MTKRSIIYILLLLCVFLLSACKDTNNKNENDEYEVKVFNSDVVSGLDDIDTFYHITNDEKKKASIVIIKEYDKDYFNKIKADSEPLAKENVIYKSKIDFDGIDYYYYYYNDDVELEGKYKYFIYSTRTNVNNEALYTFKACYILSNEADMTVELYERLITSCLLEDCLRGLESRIAFFYNFNNDLFFNVNEIISIAYLKDNELTSYNSDINSLYSIVKVLNEGEWTKDYNKLGIDFTDENNIVIVHMKRTLVCDNNNLMIKREDGNNEYNLVYDFHLDGKYVTMQYVAMSSGAHMLYAKLSDEHIELIKSTLREEMLEENNE